MVAVMALLLAQTAVARDAIQPHLTLDAEGTAYVVFIRNGNIELSTSSDQGKTFSTPVTAIDAKGKARGGMQRGPRVAVDGRKTVYVSAPLTFDESEFQKRYPTQDLYLAVSTDGGKSFSKPVMVNDQPKKAPESLHWLAASPAEGAFVAWLDIRAREKGQDLFLAKITEQGKKISRNAPLATALCECCAPGLAVDAKGNPIVAFREGGGKTNRPIGILLSKNGGSSFGPPVRLNTEDSKVDSCPMDAPAVAVGPDGKTLAAAWMDMRAGNNNRDVQWTIGTAAGRFPPETAVNDDRTGVQGHPSLAVAEDGTVWCAWEDGRSGPNSQRVYATDSKSKKNVPVSDEKEGKAAYPSLAARGGFVGAAYETPAGIVFRVVAGR